VAAGPRQDSEGPLCPVQPAEGKLAEVVLGCNDSVQERADPGRKMVAGLRRGLRPWEAVGDAEEDVLHFVGEDTTAFKLVEA